MSKPTDPSVSGVSTILTYVQIAMLDSDAGREARRRLVAIYARPIWKTLQKRRVPMNDIDDLAQEFVTQFCEGKFLHGFDPEKGRFRDWLKGCLTLFLAKHWEKGSYRHGERICDIEEPAAKESLDDVFDKEWAKAVWGKVVKAVVKRLGSDSRTRIVWTWDSQSISAARLTQAEAAKKFGLSLQEFRAALYKGRSVQVEVLREVLSDGADGPEELNAEVADFLRVINRDLPPRPEEGSGPA